MAITGHLRQLPISPEKETCVVFLAQWGTRDSIGLQRHNGFQMDREVWKCKEIVNLWRRRETPKKATKEMVAIEGNVLIGIIGLLSR